MLWRPSRAIFLPQSTFGRPSHKVLGTLKRIRFHGKCGTGEGPAANTETICGSWHKVQLRHKHYDGESDPSGAGVYVRVSYSDREFLNLDNLEIYIMVAQLCKEHDFDKDTKQSTEISRVYEILVQRLEQKLGYKLKVLKAKLPIDNIGSKYPFPAIGNPVALIVRNPEDSLNVIGSFDLQEE